MEIAKISSLTNSELGAHIDGYIGTAAHTAVVSVDSSQPVTGKAADAICAAYYAQEAVLRMMKPGTTVSNLNYYSTQLSWESRFHRSHADSN
jgi:methionine aminopeptidase